MTPGDSYISGDCKEDQEKAIKDVARSGEWSRKSQEKRVGQESVITRMRQRIKNRPLYFPTNVMIIEMKTGTDFSFNYENHHNVMVN